MCIRDRYNPLPDQAYKAGSWGYIGGENKSTTSEIPVSYTHLCRIRRSVKFLEAQAHGQSIFEYAPYSSTGIDYEIAIKRMFNIKI